MKRYRKAAEQGRADAQFELAEGIVVQSGRGQSMAGLDASGAALAVPSEPRSAFHKSLTDARIATQLAKTLRSIPALPWV